MRNLHCATGSLKRFSTHKATDTTFVSNSYQSPLLQQPLPKQECTSLAAPQQMRSAHRSRTTRPLALWCPTPHIPTPSRTNLPVMGTLHLPASDRWESSSAAHEGTSSSRRGSLASSAGQQQVIFLLKSTAQSLNTHSWAQSGWRSHLLNKKWPLLCFVTRFRADSTLKPFGVAL